jgi:Holliday junction DNA helicase RuvB
VLFIDEIHRLSRVVEEYLYSAMEDYRIDLVIDAGPNATYRADHAEPLHARGGHHAQRPAHRALARAGSASTAAWTITMRKRFEGILHRSSGILNVPIDNEAATEISRRSRGTPRIANALLPSGTRFRSDQG